MAGDGAASDFFGYSVSVSGDGKTALVGAYQNDTPAGINAGSAYVFRLGTCNNLFIACATDKTVEWGTAWAFDPPDGSATCGGTNLTIVVLSTVTNGSCPWVITRTWQGTDARTNSAICSQTVTVVDTTPPSVLSAVADGTNNRVCLTFSESVDPASATQPLNYALDRGAAVTNAVLSASNTICLFTTPLTVGLTYTVTINHVRDLCGGNEIARDSLIEIEVAGVAGLFSGVKFNDLNGDGIWQSSEPGLSNWPIYAYGQATNLAASTLTGANGQYLFGLPYGTYTIVEGQAFGWVQTAPASGSYVVSVAAGPHTGLNFGNQTNDCPTGAVYPIGAADAFWRVVSDPDGGTTEPRPATVIAKHVAWGASQANSQWISSYATAADELNGAYDFQTQFCLATNYNNILLSICLRADDWAEVYFNGVKIFQAGSATLGDGAWGTPSPICTNLDVTAWCHPGLNYLLVRVHNEYSVAMGLNLTGTVSGSGLVLEKPECCQPGASVSGRKFHDLNGNGVWDTGEPALAGWTIYCNGVATTTDANGYYYFLNLPADPNHSYTVSEGQQPKWTQTAPASGSYTLFLTNNQAVNNLNFGNSTNCCLPRTYTTSADFSEGVLMNLVNRGDQLCFPEHITPFPYVNIACSMRGTLVRIDAISGAILGEYYTAPAGPDAGLSGYGRHNAGVTSPSRTSVDLEGNVWVANRGNNASKRGTVTRIALVIGGTRGDRIGTPGHYELVSNPYGQYLQPPFLYNSGAQDRDADGLIRTSCGRINGGVPSLLPWNGPESGDGDVAAYSDGCRTPILISVGQRSNFGRTPFRFISDSVPG